jgi:hypothetical protein
MMLAPKVVGRQHELLHPCGERHLRVGDVIEPFGHVKFEVGDILFGGLLMCVGCE